MKRIFAALMVFTLLLTCCSGMQVTATENTILLQEDVTEDMSISADTLLDLNGYAISGVVTVAEGCTLTVKDSQTDDYTIADEEGCGMLQKVMGNVTAADGYLQICEADGMSFHRVDLRLTSVTLRPENAGIYYSGAFFGDEVVSANVDRFGIVLRLGVAPTAAYMRTSSAYSWYENFHSGAAGNAVTGTLLKDVMKKGCTTAENTQRSQSKIYGCAYIRTKDGQYLFSASVAYSFMQVVQQADKQWPKLDQTQKDAIKSLYNRFESIIGVWYLPNVNDTDIDIPI